MTTSAPTPANDGWARIFVACAVVLTVLFIWGLFSLRSGNAEILTAVSAHAETGGMNTFALDYTGEDGQPRHVSVQSQPDEEPAHLAMRFKAAVSAMQQTFPQRR